MIGLLILFAVVGAVAFALWTKEKGRPALTRPLPEGAVQMPLDMLHSMMDELDTARRHAIHLRKGMERLIHEWPIVFSPEELEAAKVLVDEAVEAGL